MKRIAVGQLWQESNSLNPVASTRADFEAFGTAEGPDVMERFGGTGELAGFAEFPAITGESVEWLGLVRALAWSGGPMDDAFFRGILKSLIAPLRKATVDGVLLSLHGAQCAGSEPDAAGRVLAEVRAVVGPTVPVIATLDLHANITRRMAHSADVLLGYHTFPHVDQAECGRRGAHALATLLQAKRQPKICLWKIPMAVNNEIQNTFSGPLADVWKEVVAAELPPHVLATGIFMCQPWLDVPELGWTVYEATLGQESILDMAGIARRCWEMRTYSKRDFIHPDEVVPAALAVNGWPVVVSESYDATNSGAPGDSTHLIAEFVRRDIPEGGTLTFCVDPEAVGKCFDAGQGSHVHLPIGGKRDCRYCRPIELDGQVTRLSDIAYRLSGHGGDNLDVNMGRAAVLVCGDMTLILTERTGPGSSPLLYEAVGLDPKDFKIVVVKSPEGFRREYEPFAAGILYCAAPGCSTPHLKDLNYRRVSRPFYPLDDFADASQAAWAGRWT